MSCTEKIELSDPFQLDGKEVVLVDTPGFDDTYRSDAEVLRTIATHLATAYVI